MQKLEVFGLFRQRVESLPEPRALHDFDTLAWSFFHIVSVKSAPRSHSNCHGPLSCILDFAHSTICNPISSKLEALSPAKLCETLCYITPQSALRPDETCKNPFPGLDDYSSLPVLRSRDSEEIDKERSVIT